MQKSLRVVVADDHPLYRDGVVGILRGAGLDVVGEASSAREAARLVGEHQPDLAVFDLTMPGGGIAATLEARVLSPTTRFVMLTASEDQDDLRTAIEAGASGYVLKGVAGCDLVAILRQVGDGQRYVSSTLAWSALRRRADPVVDPLARLTRREREVLDLVTEGLSNAEVGERLSLAERTVKHHMTPILEKLGARSRVDAALVGYRAGLGRREVAAS